MAAVRIPRPGLSALEALFLVATVFCVAWISALGLLLAVLGAMHGYYEGRPVLLGVFVCLATLALGLELSRL